MNTFNLLAKSYVYDERNEEVKKLLDHIIVEAHKLVTNQITVKDLSFDTFDIITTMTSNNRPNIKEYLTNININNITEADYKTLSNVLASIITDLKTK